MGEHHSNCMCGECTKGKGVQEVFHEYGEHLQKGIDSVHHSAGLHHQPFKKLPNAFK